MIAGLRCLEKLLKRKLLRERFVAVCVEPTGAAAGHHLLFENFSPKLAGLRWQVITEFCRAETHAEIVGNFLFFCVQC